MARFGVIYHKMVWMKKLFTMMHVVYITQDIGTAIPD